MALLVAVVSGCSGQTATPPRTQGAVKVGLVVSLTGAASPSAELAIQGATVAVAQAGAQAGANRVIQLIQADDKSTASGAASACSKLVSNDHVVAIVGFESAAGVTACGKAVAGAKVPYFAGLGPGVEPCAPNAFAFGFTPNQQVAPLVDFLRSKQAARTFYVLAADDAWGQSSAAVAAARVREGGGTVVGSQLVAPNTTDFTSQLATVAAARPDAVIEAVDGEEEGAFDRQLRADPRTAEIKVASLWLDATRARSVGPATVGLFVAQDYNQSDPSPGTRTWLSALLARYGDGAIPSATGAEVFDATLVMATAVRLGSDISGDAISRAAIDVAIVGPRGPVQLAHGAHGYATVPAHIGRVNKAYGVDLLEVSDPVAPLACQNP
jgi:ABC-type branched-subunit amino acid transport system substrate-binding protein